MNCVCVTFLAGLNSRKSCGVWYLNTEWPEWLSTPRNAALKVGTNETVVFANRLLKYQTATLCNPLATAQTDERDEKMIRYFASCALHDLLIECDLETDLDGQFIAMDCESGGKIRINGWLWEFFPA